MWILPRNLPPSSGAPDTAGFISDLDEQSRICASSLMVRSKPSPARTWLQKWKRDSWTRHLSGRILKPSHAKPFETAWTCLWPVIPASLFQQQASGSEPKTPATFGPTSFGQLELFAPDSAFLKMSKDTYPSDSEKSLESWEQSVTRRRGEYSARVKSARLTSGSGSSSWPTASVMDTTGGSYKTEWRDGRAVSYHNHTKENPVAYGAKLADAVKHGQAAPASSSSLGSRQGLSVDWRTPQAQEAGARVETLFTKDGAPAMPGQRAYRKTPSGKLVLQSQTINQQVEMVQNWATPRASEAKCGRTYTPGMTGKDLSKDVQQWATPRSGKTTDENPETWAKRQEKGDVATMPLTAQVKCWPTPASSGVTGGPTGLAGGSGNREKLAKMLPEADAKAMGCGKLNPRWVETLMGLPVGWTMPSCKSPVTIAPTNCASSGTESCQQQQSGLF
jgi:hypothetical protein